RVWQFIYIVLPSPGLLLAIVPTYHFTFFFECSTSPRALASFPTRRSSDLRAEVRAACPDPGALQRGGHPFLPPGPLRPGAPAGRSEEHTSELQSRFDLVCRLLLEKIKITTYTSYDSSQ